MASELMIGLWRKMVLQTKVLSAPTPLEMTFTFTYKYCKIYVRVGDQIDQIMIEGTHDMPGTKDLESFVVYYYIVRWEDVALMMEDKFITLVQAKYLLQAHPILPIYLTPNLFFYVIFNIPLILVLWMHKGRWTLKFLFQTISSNTWEKSRGSYKY